MRLSAVSIFFLQLLQQAEKEAKSMNLNQVCLCFEAFQKINGQYVSICEPILSNPINNMSMSPQWIHILFK